MERYHIIKSVFGGSDVYDSDGNKVGYSLPSILGGGEDFYDMDGNPIGQSFDGAFGGEFFSGPESSGFLDEEFLMGQNLYTHGDPFKKTDSFSDDFDSDMGFDFDSDNGDFGLE